MECQCVEMVPRYVFSTNERLVGYWLRSAVNILRRLEMQLQCHLDQPGSAEADDLAERAAGDASCGIVPVAVVQDVKDVGTELKLPALGEAEGPAHRDVEI